ncbi:AAA family ATPase [Calderihabitans maritimus]|uniref:CO dehydrogenase maturation factor n=1 Tax=Calderihabitans maritimus TaxID=1246530 RepID=A0A1Z5HQX6_9FIRM|nr:AAA family ATPase [Calderihabitans maritimus]GAW91838.1 CO dehydrogenase maturation factor [Calderihabitans maritimus]
MARNIAVAGKGGTGKTTFASLMVRYLVENGKGSILALDADPNANLNEALGLEVNTMISEILDETKDPKAIPTGMTKDMFIEYKLSQSIIETEHVDLLVMGGPQGPGCYCYPNDLLRRHLESLSKNYDYLVIDNEAGLEHISRKTIPRIDYLFLISDASVRGVRSAGRVYQLVQSLKTPVEHIGLVVTKTGEEGVAPLREEIEKTGLQLLGTVPLDPLVAEYDVAGKPLFQLPEDSVAVQAVNDILKKTGI